MLEFRPQSLDGVSLPRRAYWRTLRPLRQAWLHRGLTSADVTIASYPRSGNLWVRVLVLQALTGRMPEFGDVVRGVPPIGRHRAAPRLTPQAGRLIKSHEPYRRAYRRAVYIVRDPRDLVLSYFRHLQRRGSLVIAARDEVEAFDRFVDGFLRGRHEPHGTWAGHVGTWLDAIENGRSDIFLVRYEELRAEPRRHAAALLAWLGAPQAESDLDRILEQASIVGMRAITREFDDRVDRRQGRTEGTFHLVGSGQVGGWREILTDQQARRFAVFDRELVRAGYAPAGV